MEVLESKTADTGSSRLEETPLVIMLEGEGVYKKAYDDSCTFKHYVRHDMSHADWMVNNYSINKWPQKFKITALLMHLWHAIKKD